MTQRTPWASLLARPPIRQQLLLGRGMIMATEACGNADLKREMVLWTATLHTDLALISSGLMICLLTGLID